MLYNCTLIPPFPLVFRFLCESLGEHTFQMWCSVSGVSLTCTVLHVSLSCWRMFCSEVFRYCTLSQRKSGNYIISSGFCLMYIERFCGATEFHEAINSWTLFKVNLETCLYWFLNGLRLFCVPIQYCFSVWRSYNPKYLWNFGEFLYSRFIYNMLYRSEHSFGWLRHPSFLMVRR